jgi:hypothetical protein
VVEPRGAVDSDAPPEDIRNNEAAEGDTSAGIGAPPPQWSIEFEFRQALVVTKFEIDEPGQRTREQWEEFAWGSAWLKFWPGYGHSSIDSSFDSYVFESAGESTRCSVSVPHDALRPALVAALQYADGLRLPFAPPP